MIRHNKDVNQSQKGQTLVEFILLLAVISLFSVGLYIGSSEMLSRFWELIANEIASGGGQADAEILRIRRR